MVEGMSLISNDCKREGHTKKYYPGRQKTNGGSDRQKYLGDAAIVHDNYETSKVLVSNSSSLETEWIMDSRCS